MPNKAHKAAARQAQLRRKRRRGKGRVQEFDPGPSEATTAAAVRDALVAEAEAPESTQASPATTPGPIRRSRQRADAEPMSVYGFLGPELRQIGIITSLIAAILVVLTFVLR